MDGWPEDDGPSWEQLHSNEARRWDEEVAKRLAKCEADLTRMRGWPEYQLKLKGELKHESER